MEVSRERGGSTLRGILATGKTTARKVSGYNFMLLEINMKACGSATKGTAKVLTGEMKMVN